MPCPHGKQFPSRCKECSPPVLCPHEKRPSRCPDCDGSQICSHGRIQYGCKDCKGTSICPHDRVKSECRDCGGSRYCEHGKRKSFCSICGGQGLCTHGIKKYYCKPCGGTAYCHHGTIKARCKPCGGSAICIHDKHKSYCKICDGSVYCQHDKIKSYCRECGGSAFCQHDKLKDSCKECGGKNICIHEKHKSYCKECDGSACCKSTWCSTIPSNKRYRGYCLVCFIHLFPDEPITRNYKTKETAVANFIREKFPDKSWIFDKRSIEGCSLRRPDILCDLGSHVLMIEIDEDQHRKYDTICENKRLMEISQDVGHRPLVFIRFNPDSYTDISGKMIPSCWQHNKYGTYSIVRRENWASRLQKLEEKVLYWLEHPTDKTIEIVQLYFTYPL